MLSLEFFILVILICVRWNLSHSDLRFSKDLDVLRIPNISLSTYGPLEIPLLRILCLVLYPNFIVGVFVSLVSNFLNSLHILDISPLSDVGLGKILSHFIG